MKFPTGAKLGKNKDGQGDIKSIELNANFSIQNRFAMTTLAVENVKIRVALRGILKGVNG